MVATFLDEPAVLTLQVMDSLIFVEEILTHSLGPIAREACRPHPAEH